MAVHPDVVDFFYQLVERIRKEAYGDGATEGYERGFADGEQQGLDKGRQSAPQYNIQPDPTNEKGNTTPTPKPENPYDPSRPLRDEFIHLDGLDLPVGELKDGFDRPQLATGIILSLVRSGITTVRALVDKSEDELLLDKTNGIGPVRMAELKIALTRLNEQVAHNSD